MYHQNLYINSISRENGTVNNFTVQLPKPIKDVECILVKSVEIPFSFFVITTARNTFKFFNTATTYTVTITPGNYSSSELVTELQTKMNAAFPGNTVTFSNITNKLTFANASPIKLVYAGNTIAPIIGLSADTSSGTSVTCQNVLDLTGTNHIYVMSDIVDSAQNIPYCDSNKRGILHRVVNDQGPGAIIIDKAQAYLASEYYFNSQFILSTFNLRLVDENFVDLDLNGLDWNIELHCKLRTL